MAKHPRCYGCDEKPARRLKLPGSYGQVEMYCSLRCAARMALERMLAGGVGWCGKHRKWVDEDECPECEREDPEET